MSYRTGNRSLFSGMVCKGCGNFRALHTFSTDIRNRGISGGAQIHETCNDCRRNKGFFTQGPRRPATPPRAQPPRQVSSVQNNIYTAYILAFISLFLTVSVIVITIPYLLVGEFPCDRSEGSWNATQCFYAAWWEVKMIEYDLPYVTAHAAFWSLFWIRYFRLFVSIVSYFYYKPSPLPRNPTHTARDVTVVIPTVDFGAAFYACVRSIAANRPAYIYLVTVGQENHDSIEISLRDQGIRAEFPTVNFQVYHTEVANKRGQIDSVIGLIRTEVTSMADASVLWGPRFLRSGLAPLEDPNCWLVGTNKRVQRSREGSWLDPMSWNASFWNFIGCLYLERHNFDLRSQNAITGEVFVISGRTNLIRTHVLQDPAFREGYTNERFFFNLFGPIAADDDNFIVRWILARGKTMKFQFDDDAMLGIAPIGEFPRFFGQLLRWVRTTWRSNPRALLIPHVWVRQPYSVYSIYVTSFFNFALFFDALLVYLFLQTPYVTDAGDDWITPVSIFIGWIACSKMVKLITYFWRHPVDLLWFPGYIAFAYFHSLIKLWAMFTFYNVAWSGRNLQEAGGEAPTVPIQTLVERLRTFFYWALGVAFAVLVALNLGMEFYLS